MSDRDDESRWAGDAIRSAWHLRHLKIVTRRAMTGDTEALATLLSDMQEISNRLQDAGREMLERLAHCGPKEEEMGRELAERARSSHDVIDPLGFWVYCLWGEDDDVPLYVGQSSNILARLGSHMGDQYKRRRVRRVTLIRCATVSEMKRSEARLIAHWQPTLNIVGVASKFAMRNVQLPEALA